MTTKYELMAVCVFILCVCGCGGARREDYSDVGSFPEIIKESEPWVHQRQIDLLSAYNIAKNEEKSQYRSLLVRRILEERQFELARHLFIVAINASWLQEHPEMRDDYDRMIGHLNKLSDLQNGRSEFYIINVKGVEQVAERVTVH